MLDDQHFDTQALSLRQDTNVTKAEANVFAVELAVRFFRFYQHRLSKLAASEAQMSFKAMPSYSYVLCLANRKLDKFKYRLGKRRSAKKARLTAIYRIGPEVRLGTRPIARITRTLMGFAEDFARGHPGGVRKAWNDFENPLREISSDFSKIDAEVDPRRDAYRFSIDGHSEPFQFGQFEKAYTRSRKPIATIAELLRQQKVPGRRR